MTPTPMEALLTNLGSVVTAMFTYIGTAASTIVGSPFLLLTTGIMLAGAGFGLLSRALSRS